MRRLFLLLPALMFALVACPQPTPAISVSPSSTTLGTNESLQFTATTNNLSSTAVTWYVNDVAGGNATVGTISATGLYKAPQVSANTNFTIKAVSAVDSTKFASATVTVRPISVAITPTTANVSAINSQQFSATVNNATNQAVIWSVNNIVGGDSTVGTISASGLYTAPTTATNVTIKATSVADPNKFAAATVTVAARQGISGTITIASTAVLAMSTQVSTQRLQTQAETMWPATPNWSAPHVRGQVLVVTSTGTISSQSISRLQTLGAKKVSQNFSKVLVPNGQDEQIFATQLAQDTGLVVQPNYKYQTLATPNDPKYANQTYLPQIQMPAAWDIQKIGAKIAVIDTGMELTHPELTGRLLVGYDFCATLNQAGDCTGEDTDPTDTVDGHGTNVTGLIAASTDNGSMIAGVMWGGGPVLPIKIFEQGAGATSVELDKAIRYAADQGAKVINMSLGFATTATNLAPDFIVNKAIDYADSKDVLMVASSGNYQTAPAVRPVFYPASNSKVLSVGSVNSNSANPTLSNFSGYGPELDLVAPGENILSITKGGTTAAYTGTSESAPLVAGVAALIRAKNPALTSLQTISILESTAKDLGSAGRDDSYGFGMVQAADALTKASPATAPQSYRIIVFADYEYSTTNPSGGQTTIVVDKGGSAVPYHISNSRNGALLPNGNYIMSACVDINRNDICEPTETLIDPTPNNNPYMYTGPLITANFTK